MYVPCTHCCVCLREFHNRENCLNHLRYRSKVCLTNSFLRGPLLSISEANALDDACKARNRDLYARGKKRNTTEFPSFYLDGPLLPIVLDAGKFSPHHPLGKGHNYN